MNRKRKNESASDDELTFGSELSNSSLDEDELKKKQIKYPEVEFSISDNNNEQINEKMLNQDVDKNVKSNKQIKKKSYDANSDDIAYIFKRKSVKKKGMNDESDLVHFIDFSSRRENEKRRLENMKNQNIYKKDRDLYDHISEKRVDNFEREPYQDFLLNQNRKYMQENARMITKKITKNIKSSFINYYEPREINNFNKEVKKRNKSLKDYLFDAVNEEAKNLNINESNTKMKIPFNVTEDVSKNKTKNPPPNLLDYQGVIKFTDNSKKSFQKKRGRPASFSSDFASTDFDNQGMKVDYETGGIDFKDELFINYENIDSRDFVCPDASCKKKFPSLSRAKRHYIVHTGHKPYKCLNEDCPKSFSRKDNMLQHYNKHCSARKKAKKE